MSSRDTGAHFADILNAIDRVQSFLGHATFEQYESDDFLRSAIERLILILSEAGKRLGAEADTLCPGPDWPSIHALGNVLRHEYHKIIDIQIWSVIKERLPALEMDVAEALKRHGSSSAP